MCQVLLGTAGINPENQTPFLTDKEARLRGAEVLNPEGPVSGGRAGIPPTSSPLQRLEE